MQITGRVEYKDSRGNSLWKLIGSAARFIGRSVIDGLPGGAQAYLKGLNNNDSGMGSYGGVNSSINNTGYNPNLSTVSLNDLLKPSTPVNVKFTPFVPKQPKVDFQLPNFNLLGNNAPRGIFGGALNNNWANNNQHQPKVDFQMPNVNNSNNDAFKGLGYTQNNSWANTNLYHPQINPWANIKYYNHPDYQRYRYEYFNNNPLYYPNDNAFMHGMRKGAAHRYAKEMIDRDRQERINRQVLQNFQAYYKLYGGGGAKPSIGNANNVPQNKPANTTPDLRSPLETPEDTKNIETLRKSLQEQRNRIYYYNQKVGRYLYKKYPPDKTDLAILKETLQQAAKLAKNDPDKFMLYTDELLVGNEFPQSPQKLAQIIQDLSRLQVSKRATIHLSDSGWFRGYRDYTENQTFHTWSFVKIAYQYPRVASILNLYHEKYQTGIDTRGQTIEDYRVSKVGIIIGEMLKYKVSTPKQIADNIDIYLGTDILYDKNWDKVGIKSTPNPYTGEHLPRAAYK